MGSLQSVTPCFLPLVMMAFFFFWQCSPNFDPIQVTCLSHPLHEAFVGNDTTWSWHPSQAWVGATAPTEMSHLTQFI